MRLLDSFDNELDGTLGKLLACCYGPVPLPCSVSLPNSEPLSLPLGARALTSRHEADNTIAVHIENKKKEDVCTQNYSRAFIHVV